MSVGENRHLLVVSTCQPWWYVKSNCVFQWFGIQFNRFKTGVALTLTQCLKNTNLDDMVRLIIHKTHAPLIEHLTHRSFMYDSTQHWLLHRIFVTPWFACTFFKDMREYDAFSYVMYCVIEYENTWLLSMSSTIVCWHASKHSRHIKVRRCTINVLCCHTRTIPIIITQGEGERKGFSLWEMRRAVTSIMFHTS